MLQTTDRFEKVIKLAQNEAEQLHKEYISTEHILLALLREDFPCVANKILEKLDINIKKLRSEIINFIKENKEF